MGERTGEGEGGGVMLESNSLSSRAETVRQLVAESDAAALNSIEKALQAGRELAAAKAECRHGEWLPFLERAGIKERKAQRYMRLAESGLKSDTVTDLGGIRGALEFLALRKLPEAGRSLIIFGDESRSFLNAAYVWGSVEHPGYFYIVAYNGGLHGVMTCRPLLGRALHEDGEQPYYAVWEWVERHFDAPPGLWQLETGNDDVAEIMFRAMGLDDFHAIERTDLRFGNAAGLRSLIEQCQAVRMKEAA